MTSPASPAPSVATPSPSPSTQTRQQAEKVLVLDFGSQYAQLIARRVREQHVYCEIVRHDITAARIRELAPRGIILSGGPASVYDEAAPRCDPAIFRLGIPVLGICYGMQLACDALGGRVGRAAAREYGRSECDVVEADTLFVGVPALLGKNGIERIIEIKLTPEESAALKKSVAAVEKTCAEVDAAN